LIVVHKPIVEADLERRKDWLINPFSRHRVNLRLTTLRSEMACSSGPHVGSKHLLLALQEARTDRLHPVRLEKVEEPQ
jgi:hypothetical protein